MRTVSIILGIDDPAFQCKSYRQGELIRLNLKLHSGTDSFTILLAHRPELETYSHFGIDLVFGHAHGGQIRLPLVVVWSHQGRVSRATQRHL